MSELQKQILALSPSEKLELIAFLADALKEDELFQKALDRREAIRNGQAEPFTLQEIQRRFYGDKL